VSWFTSTTRAPHVVVEPGHAQECCVLVARQDHIESLVGGLGDAPFLVDFVRR